jgi:excisionase family DNA binding protein
MVCSADSLEPSVTTTDKGNAVMPIDVIALTIPGAVARSGNTVSRTRIYEAIKDGQLPSYKIGRRRTLKPDEYDKWFGNQLKADTKVRPLGPAKTAGEARYKEPGLEPIGEVVGRILAKHAR